MFEWAIKQIISNFPQIAGYFCVFIIACLATYKFSNFYCKTKNTNEKLPTFEKLLNKIDASLTSLNAILVEKKVIKTNLYSQTNSPRELNDLGRRLFKESNAEDIYSQHKDEFIKKLEDENIKTALEAEHKSFVLCLSILSEDMRFKKVQDFVYNNPKYPNKTTGQDLDLGTVAFVMSLQLRNDYLANHSGLIIKDTL